MGRYNSCAVFLLGAIALVIASGFSLGAAMLALGSIVLLRGRKPTLGRDDRLLIAAFALYFLVNAASNGWHGAPLPEYDAPTRFLLAIPALLLLLTYPFRPGALWAGLATGGVGAGLLALWQFVVDGQLRPGGSTNPIQYGNISLLLGMLCLCGLAWALSRKRKLGWSALLAAGAMGGILGALLSGSRGSWIALPFCLLLLAPQYAGTDGKRYLLAGLLALVALIGLLYALPDSPLRARSDLALRETRAYFASGNADSSVGARLEMWRAGIAMVPAHPWLGWGKQGYMRHKLALVAQGQTAAVTGEHTHLHNEYLDALVKRGGIGLAALLVLYLAPLLLFARRLRQCGLDKQPYALAGVVLCVSYILFGLTQAFLSHNNGVMMFAFLTAILWAAPGRAGCGPAMPARFPLHPQ